MSRANTASDRLDDLRRRVSATLHWHPTKGQAGKGRPSILPEAIPFQDPIGEICEEHPPRLLRSAHYYVVGLFLSLLLVASLVSVEIVVVGSGRLTTDTPSIVLQPMERSIIRELRVKPGDIVTKGQVLATLDPTFTEADLASASAQRSSVLAQVHRIEAELADKPFEMTGAPTSDDLLQQTLYQQRQAQYRSQLRVFDQEIERIQANIKTTDEDRISLQKQLQITKGVEEMRGSLLQKGWDSKLQFMESQAVRMRAERDSGDAVNRLVELQHSLESKQAERQVFADQWRRQLYENLVAARADADRLGDGVTKAARMNDLVVLSAPEDGVVLELAKRSVGSVLREAEPLVTIVPTNATLIADIVINSGDVGYAKPGDEVFVKIDAFPYQHHGMMKGRLLSISEDSFSPSGSGQDGTVARTAGGAVHRGRVALIDTRLDNLPDGIRPIPGMTLVAEIKVGSRSVLSYFLYPFTRGFKESFREP